MPESPQPLDRRSRLLVTAVMIWAGILALGALGVVVFRGLPLIAGARFPLAVLTFGFLMILAGKSALGHSQFGRKVLSSLLAVSSGVSLVYTASLVFISLQGIPGVSNAYARLLPVAILIALITCSFSLALMVCRLAVNYRASPRQELPD